MIRERTHRLEGLHGIRKQKGNELLKEGRKSYGQIMSHEAMSYESYENIETTE